MHTQCFSLSRTENKMYQLVIKNWAKMLYFLIHKS